MNRTLGQRRERGQRGRLQRSSRPPEPAGPAPLPPWPRASCCLDDIQTKVCVLFSGFPAWGCSAGADHQGESCAHSAPWSNWSRKGTPGVILGILLPLTQHALSVINLHVHSVRGSEAAGARDPLSTHSCCAPPPDPHTPPLRAHPEQGPRWAWGGAERTHVVPERVDYVIARFSLCIQESDWFDPR